MLACPGDLHAGFLADAMHGDADPLDQVADQLLAVGVGSGGSVPDRGQVSGRGPDLVAFGGGQRPGLSGGEPVRRTVVGNAAERRSMLGSRAVSNLPRVAAELCLTPASYPVR